MISITEKLLASLKTVGASTLKKGGEIFSKAPEIVSFIEEDTGLYQYQVESSLGDDLYFVQIDTTKQAVKSDCTCIAHENWNECKHLVAATMDLIAFLDESGQLNSKNEIIKALKSPSSSVKPKPATVIPIVKELPMETQPQWSSFKTPVSGISNYISWNIKKEQSRLVDYTSTKLEKHDPEGPAWQFIYKGVMKDVHYPVIKYDRFETFSYCCTCRSKLQMCKHVAVAFDKLCIGSQNSFLQYRNFDEEKSGLLAEYGLTLADAEASHFKFYVDSWGYLHSVAPHWLLKPNDKAGLLKIKNALTPVLDNKNRLSRPLLPGGKLIDFRIGFLINLSSNKFKIGFEFEIFKIFSQPGAIKNNYKKLSLHNPENLVYLNSLPDDVYELIESLSEQKLKLWLRDQGFGYVMNYSSPFQHITDDTVKFLKQRYIAQLQKLWPWLCESTDVFLLKEGKFSNQSLEPVQLQMPMVKLKAGLQEDHRFIKVKIVPEVNNAELPGVNVVTVHDFMYLSGDKAWIIEKLEDAQTLALMPKGMLLIPHSNKLELIKNLLPVLIERYDLELPASFTVNRVETDPGVQILLKEYLDQYLMVVPQFRYEDETVDFERQPEDILITHPGGNMLLITRDADRETAFYESLRTLHPLFKNQRQNDFYYLPFGEVMKNNWFIEMVNSMQEQNIPVLGIQQLKKFRYNTNKPKWEMKAGSGIDWFELKIEVSFGDEVVPLKDIRKAILSKQNVVLLGDGTIGLLPEQWLNQYGMLLKMGDEQKDGTLQVSKLHFTLVDELYQQIDDEAILAELDSKKQKLGAINSILPVVQSKALKAMLRPYQVSGFNWLHTLDELGWGACLADDMGLGKTLQAISFLQYLKEKYKGSTHLIVCPTSLIYNWENELKKFAPKLKYHIYYGRDREFSDEHFEDYDLVITSYGMIRSDLNDLLKFKWHYVVLDESQAIKNPDAQTTKAVQLLKCINRVIMSGTPIQNNTFDLYAQFQFINPGLLGNKEFFRTEFANPIDKYNDAEKTAALRRLVYPFLLRRTKEQV